MTSFGRGAELLEANLIIIEEAGFKRIADTIREAWGKPRCIAVLNNLLVVDKGREAREGFPLSVFSAIATLRNQIETEKELPFSLT